jgi:hypothetical protein
MADRPRSSSSTDLQLGIPLYHLLESIAVMPTRERLQGIRYTPENITNHPLGSLINGLCTLPPCVRYTPGVTLILVEFQISL